MGLKIFIGERKIKYWDLSTKSNLSFKQRELNIKSAQKNMYEIISEIKDYKPRKHEVIEDEYVAYTNKTNRQTDRQTDSQPEEGRGGGREEGGR